ncbi:TrkH family potassium uptake protein [Corynebacterium heidelbergense]|nr:potassium transporter TrkG [Corynebacterium heidelbergense]
MKERNGAPRVKPTQLVTGGFFGLIMVGALLLSLPVASASGEATPFFHSMFTATSAVCVTGLVVVDTGTHWSTFGQVIIVLLIQLGGFGIMSLTSLAGMLLTGKLGLRQQMNAAAEGRSGNIGNVRRTISATLRLTATVEFIVAVILVIRFRQEYGMSLGRAMWEGLFHAVSAFNNAGFGLRSDSLVPYVGDAWIIIPLAGALIIGGLGFPVLAELVIKVKRSWRFRRVGGHPMRLSVTSRITLWCTAFLIVVGSVAVGLAEWTHAMQGLPVHTKVLAAFFQGVSPRTAGFNSLDYAELHPATLIITDMLMFVGGGSAGTAGGVKITTVAIMLAAAFAEFRGDNATTIGGRRIEDTVVRQAMTVAAAGVILVVFSVVAVEIMDVQFTSDQIMFEVISAFGTVGLSTGITAQLTAGSQAVLMMLMFLGRVGPITLVTALASRNRKRRYDLPSERPFIG